MHTQAMVLLFSITTTPKATTVLEMLGRAWLNPA
jgi:hypothetical protein